MTHKQFDAVRHLMGFTYTKPTDRGKKGWKKRRFEQSIVSYPAPICAKSISKFADGLVKDSGLSEFGAEKGGGAMFDANKIVCQLVSSLNIIPTHVHLQVLGDGFRAMCSTSIVSGSAPASGDRERGWRDLFHLHRKPVSETLFKRIFIHSSLLFAICSLLQIAL